MPKLLRAPIGRYLVLAQPGKHRLFVLNPLAAWIWEAQAAGWNEQAMAKALARRFGKPDAETLEDVHKTCRWLAMECREAMPAADPVEAAPGLKTATPAPGTSDLVNGNESHPRSVAAPPPNGYPAVASVTPETLPPHSPNDQTWRLSIADTSVDLRIDHPGLASAAGALVEPLSTWRSGPRAHTLRLAGPPNAWSLHADGAWRGEGTGLDEALVALVSALMDLGADSANRLLVVHGAGLAMPDGRGLLLIAPGGSGKTTLAAALNAESHGLLNDDVVPVTPDGRLVALGTPICLKAGSWPVLSELRPDLAKTAGMRRHGQTVRFLPPRGPRVTRPVPTGLLLFPRYLPGSAPVAEALTPEAVLRGVIEADAVIRDLTQEKLEGIVRWVQIGRASCRERV